ncbi:MAG: hypothetical protein SF162_01350 [bacterium]|nr:hypothetical protein [bacterium]
MPKFQDDQRRRQSGGRRSQAPQDTPLDQAITLTLHKEYPVTPAIRQEIWDGLLAKVEAHTQRPCSAPEPVCRPSAPDHERTSDDTFLIRILRMLTDTLENSARFLFADEILLERARQYPLPHVSHLLLVRSGFTIGCA